MRRGRRGRGQRGRPGTRGDDRLRMAVQDVQNDVSTVGFEMSELRCMTWRVVYILLCICHEQGTGESDDDDLAPPPPVWMTGNQWQDANWHVHGVYGLPILRFVPGFRETWSHMSCTLHVVCEGILKRILDFMRLKPNLPHSFVKAAAGIGWKYYDDLQKTSKKVSEMDKLPPTLSSKKDWKGVDYLNFLLYQLPLLVSDENVIGNSMYYEMLVHLANSVYLLHHGFLDDELMLALQESVRRFAETYVAVLGESNCTWKFHVFQHFPMLVKIHGPAFLWDTFNGERILGMLKYDVKSTRLQILQATTAFMLRHQCTIFQRKPDTYPARAAKILKKLGIFKEHAALARLENRPMRMKDIQPENIEQAELDRVKRCAEEELGILPASFQFQELKRVTKFHRRHMTFSTCFSVRTVRSKTDNSYISIDENTFGRVNDIIWIRSKAIFDVQLYEKRRIQLQSGSDVTFPLNQFAVKRTNLFKTFVLNDDMTLRKIVYSRLRHKWWPEGVDVDLFAIRPNEWFHF